MFRLALDDGRAPQSAHSCQGSCLCSDRGVAPHFESFDKGHRGSGRRKGIFEPSEFVYNPDEDLFICPAGELLEPRKFKKKRNHFEYSLSAKVCNKCVLKPQCTRSKQGRTIKRHIRQDELDQMLSLSESRQAKRDIAKRQHLMERSFARSKRYGYKRARWRRLWRVQIQDLAAGHCLLRGEKPRHGLRHC